MKPQKNSRIEFRKAETADADECWAVVSAAKAKMHSLGRNQWQGEYPARSDIKRDIACGVARMMTCDGVAAGYGALIFTGEKAYDKIYDGKWLTSSTSTEARYSVLHRLAVLPEMWGKGIAGRFFEESMKETGERGCESMRVDTNYDNDIMLHILPKIGFTRCGRVQLPGGERIAFEKMA